jgi:hypothetical protein
MKDLQGDEHECQFPEEQEPSGRLILTPCLECGLSAFDALKQREVENKALREQLHEKKEYSSCYKCAYAHFREMLKEPYSYSGEIPCLSCKRFVYLFDNFKEVSS